MASKSEELKSEMQEQPVAAAAIETPAPKRRGRPEAMMYTSA